MKKDMMQSFELFQPRDLDGAVELLDRWGERGWAIAGGYDSLDWFKDRIKTPDAVIDLDGIEELRGIRETEDGIEIGALTTLTEVERSPMVRERYGLLGEPGSNPRRFVLLYENPEEIDAQVKTDEERDARFEREKTEFLKHRASISSR